MCKEGGSLGDVESVRAPALYCTDPALAFLVGQKFEVAVRSQVAGAGVPQVVQLPVDEVPSALPNVLCVAFFRNFSGQVLSFVFGHVNNSSRLEIWSGLRVDSDRVNHSDVVGEGDGGDVNNTRNAGEPGKRTE